MESGQSGCSSYRGSNILSDILARRRISRRRFVGLSAAAAAAVTAGGLVLPRRRSRPAAAQGFFFEPPVRSSAGGLLDTTLECAFGPVMAAGQAMTTYAYEGSYPGPTLKVRPGDQLRVKLNNALNMVTNLHMHGFHVSPDSPADNVLMEIAAGESFQYVYDIPANHPGGTYWYHPHFHGDSNEQVFGGMAGAVIIEGDIDQVPGIAGLPGRLLVLQATEFEADGSLTPPDQRQQGKFLRLVNGQLNPTLTIRPGETQRWRILNASANIFFRLGLGNNEPMHQVASDGNTLREVWTRDEIVLGPAERADVLIQGPPPGEYVLVARNFSLGATTEPEVVLATLVSQGEPVEGAPLPTMLLPFDDLRQAAVDLRREMHFQVGPNKFFAIDGKQFDMDRVDITAQLNTTEEWEIFNDSDVFHPFHIHINPFQVIAINGRPVERYGYEDTIPLPPHGSVTMRTRFLDFTGRFVFHCHILAHEDAGMMGIIEVVDGDTFSRRSDTITATTRFNCDVPGAGSAPQQDTVLRAAPPGMSQTV